MSGTGELTAPSNCTRKSHGRRWMESRNLRTMMSTLRAGTVRSYIARLGNMTDLYPPSSASVQYPDIYNYFIETPSLSIMQKSHEDNFPQIYIYIYITLLFALVVVVIIVLLYVVNNVNEIILLI